MEKKTFKVKVFRTYYISEIVEVSAKSPDEAQMKAMNDLEKRDLSIDELQVDVTETEIVD